MIFNSFIYIDIRNIRSDSLYKGRLHLIDKGKAFLAHNFIVYLNNTFLETHTHHPPKNFLRSDFRQTAGLFQVGAELHLLQKDKRQYLNNPLIGYLNINNVRNKTADLQIFIQNIPLDYLVLSETKLDESFPNAQFNLDGYEIRARRDRDKNGGSLNVFVRRGIICKRISDFELNFSECICSELKYQNVDGFVLGYTNLQILVTFQYFLRNYQSR